MVYCSLKNDTYYESQADVLEYLIKNENGDIIYSGRSIKSPKTYTNRINVTEKIRNYLFSDLGTGWESGSTDTVRQQENAFGVFALTNGELLLESYAFIFDWEESFTGDDEILSEPVNSKIDPRMKILWSRFGENSASINVEKGYSDIEFRYMGEKNFDFSATTRGFYYQSLDNSVIGFGTDDDWFTITKTSNEIFTITVQTNTGNSDRNGSFYITYYNENFNLVREYYDIVQYREHLYINFSGDTYLGFESGTTQINFSANTIIECVSGSSWLNVTSIEQEVLEVPYGIYSVVGTINLSYQTNLGEEERSGDISFRRANYVYGEVQTLPFTQEHYYYFDLLSDSAYTVDYEQHSILLSADTNADSVFIQPSGNWISGTFSGGTISLTINENLTETGRSANIYIYTNYSPNVPVCVINVLQGVDYYNVYLTMEMLENGTVYVNQVKKPITDYGYAEGWPIYFSINGGEWTGRNPGSSINVSNGDIIRLKSNGPADKMIQNYYTTFSGTTARFNLYGNILSMDYSDNFRNYNSISVDFAFFALFYQTGVVDAKNVKFPTNTTDNCYRGLFNNCTNLVTAPEVLPASIVLQEAYEQMFYNCRLLKTAPEMPLTSVSYRSCRSMFYDCRSLTKAPSVLAAVGQGSYYYMFINCYELETAPELRFKTFGSYSCFSMFNNCKKLNYIKCLATDISAENCTLGWTKNVSGTGIFVKKSSMSSWPTGDSGIPNGWTVQNA